MSPRRSHFHVVLHVDRSRALMWSDAEVATRYGQLFPRAVRQAESLPERARAEVVARWRARLWDLSWFMRCLNELIARRANHEDGCTGRFWEGRFRSQALLDLGALLTCMAYVDLNPVRAGMATALEDCDWTSIQARLVAAACGDAVAPTGLAPFADQTPDGVEPLPMVFGEYVEVLRWTATALRGADGAAAVPSPVAETMRQTGLACNRFVEGVRTFGRSFFTMVGHAHRIDVESHRRGYRRRPGLPAARRLYGAAAA